ncbi:MAG: hypothetical protein AAGD25_14045 [Cyanobacteria bacterium P01_F01_bin.150]
MRSLVDKPEEPTHYIVGRYGFDPGFVDREELWINWQVFDQTFEIKTHVISRRKEVYVDGQSIVMRMGESEKAQFLAIYPNGIEALLDGASLLLVRIFVEAEDPEQLLRIQAVINQNKKAISSKGILPTIEGQ